MDLFELGKVGSKLLLQVMTPGKNLLFDTRDVSGVDGLVWVEAKLLFQ